MPLCVNRMRSTSTLSQAKDGSEVTCKISSLQIPGLVNIQKANWNMAIEIVSFPINSMVMFHSYVKVDQRDTVCHLQICPGGTFQCHFEKNDVLSPDQRRCFPCRQLPAEDESLLRNDKLRPEYTGVQFQMGFGSGYSMV